MVSKNILVSAIHPANAIAPIDVTLGREIDDMELHPPKQWAPIVIDDSFSVTVDNWVQFIKTPVPRSVIAGMVMDCMAVLLNAYDEMVVVFRKVRD